MKQYSYEYVICKEASRGVFNRQCEAIENSIPEIVKANELLEDVDGSLIQLYNLAGKEIKVLSDEDVGYVVVKSDVDLASYFQ